MGEPQQNNNTDETTKLISEAHALRERVANLSRGLDLCNESKDEDYQFQHDVQLAIIRDELITITGMIDQAIAKVLYGIHHCDHELIELVEQLLGLYSLVADDLVLMRESCEEL